jgi:RNA polymerase sigma-70 factor (ECF subfamily)
MDTAARRSPSAPSPPARAVELADFRAVYDAHFAFVWRALLHFGVPTALAEDAAQEVFVTLHRRLDDYDGSTPLRSWLWGMCRRVAHGERRKLARADRRATVARAPSPHVPPDTALERRQAADFVQGFLDGLTHELREVFVMMELEGMSATEVAHAIGQKPNTVYSRLRLAREQLERAGARLRAREARAAG